MKREIDVPDKEWLTEEEAVAWLPINAYLFRQYVNAGCVPGVRELSRQCVLYHWQGLVCFLWRLHLGDLPSLDEEAEKPAKVGKSQPKSAKVDESGS